MKCAGCGTVNPEDAKFCLNCGGKLVLVCPQCGYELPFQARFCLDCGAQVAAAPPPPSPPAPDAMAHRLRRLVPREYAERLLATRGQVSPERRVVTVLFCDVKGSVALAEELDPEEWMEIMDGAFDLLIEPVYRYQGTLARLMGDAILAFFGAPIAREDDPKRACRAALGIVEGIQEYALRVQQERGVQGFNVRVGINTGLAVVGEVGSDLRVEYTAMGDAVNLAARLEQNAPPGGILISHDTYRHVRGIFDVQTREPLHIKGRSDPVQTYLVERAKPRAFHKPAWGVEGIETRMVGREAELKHLQDAFHTVIEDSELQMVTVTGEAGVGKSRLIHEFDLWSELLPEPFYYFKGRASPEMQYQPYSLIRDLLAFRFEILDSDPQAVVREKLESGVGEALGTGGNSGLVPGEHSALQRAAHSIGHLAGFELGASPHLTAATDDAQAFREQALDSLQRYFQAMARHLPVLILLEDLHWADESSLDGLGLLAQALESSPVMVVGAARPALFERRPYWGEGQAFHNQLALEPLSRWDSRRLVVEILQRVGEVPDRLRDLVVEGAEGNPFFIEELVKMLVEEGVIAIAEERWELDLSRLGQGRVPATLTGVLQARLDRLPPEERAVLQQASVVGRLFWDRVVARMSEEAGDGLEGAGLQGSLRTLREREMILRREHSAFAGAQEYLFKHALLQEVTYESVLKRRRQVYHGLVADWLLEQGGERLGEYYGLIADHLVLAGRSGEAVGYLLQAGDRARNLYALQEAILAYERALALLKEGGDFELAARTQMKLGLTYHNAFDFRQARRAYEDGFALWQKAGGMSQTGPLRPAPHGLRVGHALVLTLDPGANPDDDTSVVIEHLLSGLVDLTPEMDIVPDVARSWEVLDEGRRYLFRLRDDVSWTDGAPVTASDFVYAWRRILDPATGSGTAGFLHDIVGARAYNLGQDPDPDQVGVRALDDQTLVVELERPMGHFLQLLRYLPPLPRHVVAARGDAWAEAGTMVTNGPFMLEDWQPGERLVLRRNPAYHGSFTGNVDRVELCVTPLEEWPARLELYEAGKLDILETSWFPVAEVDASRQRHPDEYVSFPVPALFYAAFDASQPPFDDARVRRAFVMAVDREALADVACRGYYFPATGGMIPPGMPGHSPATGLPYDPNRARSLLAEAGYPGGDGFPALELPVWRGREFLGEYSVEQWQENLGVPITLGPALDWPSYLSMRDSLSPLLWLGGWMADYPDPDNFLGLGMRNWTRSCWQDQTYLGPVEKAGQITEQAQRIALYRRADRIAVEQAAILPLVHPRVHLLVKPWVKRCPTSPLRCWFWKDVVLEAH